MAAISNGKIFFWWNLVIFSLPAKHERKMCKGSQFSHCNSCKTKALQCIFFMSKCIHSPLKFFENLYILIEIQWKKVKICLLLRLNRHFLFRKWHDSALLLLHLLILTRKIFFSGRYVLLLHGSMTEPLLSYLMQDQ